MCCFPEDAGLDSACFKMSYDVLVMAVRQQRGREGKRRGKGGGKGGEKEGKEGGLCMARVYVALPASR